MRRLLLVSSLVGFLEGQAPLRVVAVERRGPPPYEQGDRVYVVDGGRERGLRPGARLMVKRPGSGPLGHLRLEDVRADRAEARFEPAGSGFPMKGDLVFREELRALPEVPGLDPESLPVVPSPREGAEAPPREGVLFFLPQKADLSPAGVKKVEGWVRDWGREGRWVVQVPAAKGLRPVLQKQRGETLQAVLRTMGVMQVAVETAPRTAEGSYDPAWVKHWD